MTACIVTIQAVPEKNKVTPPRKSFSFSPFKRIKKIYDCIMGNDENCTPDEIILTRTILIIGAAQLYYRIVYSPMLIEWQRQKALKQKQHKSAPSPTLTKDKKCCVCFENEQLSDIPCNGGWHAQQICTTCLSLWKQKSSTCPVCRAAFL